MTDDVIRCVAWCPNPKMSLLAVASGKRLLLINPKVGDRILTRKMDDILEEKPKTNDVMGMIDFFLILIFLIFSKY